MCRSEEIASGVNGRAVCNSTGSYPAGSPYLQPKKFTGKERDSESGLDYFGARYYGSSMGRFMSPDPVFATVNRLMDPQQWNMYSYAGNNPLSNTDPTGLDFNITGCGSTNTTNCSNGTLKHLKQKRSNRSGGIDLRPSSP
jgi:RHS repeat-associated protein